ncbi:biotin carboxylase [Sphingomonas sp. Leaf25]|uniref:biotin carboxylase n=1 Tax=Sphingomonas sp. Leaf25 TaxID=1735692 RepID=UPI0006FA9050|nr:biotin carboxylase [Sphingomonas sp. Leaf25]KQM98107.1 biotin carboxylase [Sphingomonas sp. Leaf25]
MTQRCVAILYQALPPPVIDGLRKDAKPGGYSDGGADIAVALQGRGVTVATPVAAPDPAVALDWVFPDTAAGIAAAIAAGADTIWANTVLFAGHPLEQVRAPVGIVGQEPAAMQRFDDKFATNRMLGDAGLPVAGSFLLSGSARPGVVALDGVAGAIVTRGMAFPLIVKPVRGRGSQGVTLVADLPGLVAAAGALIAAATFGDMLMVEAYLPGEEMTITVLPPEAPRPDGRVAGGQHALRPVLRFDQRGGVAPYNGDVPVSANSVAIPAARMDEPAVVAMVAACEAAAAMVGSRSAIRIDCRADAGGNFHLFDLNMKPNMTGPGRPGRDDQDCLSAIAARADGWEYADLLLAMLAARWVAG